MKMSASLYDWCIPSYLQTLTAVSGVLDKGLAHCKANNIDPNQIVEHRIAPDMLPFRFQVVAVAHHAQGTIQSVADGKFYPPRMNSTEDYAALQQLILDARDAVSKASADAFNAGENRGIDFHLGENVIPFTVPNFLASFSLPNLYFHASNIYTVLRGMGVPLGKGDYLGPMRIGR
jgi:hypothetical protein